MILNTMDFGNLLVLDGYANLAESDTVQYTHSLMNLPEVRLRNMVYIQHIFIIGYSLLLNVDDIFYSKDRDSYANSSVLILGGGDGGLLKELLELKKPPKQVIMIDLDEAVMVGCSKHMRSVSGNYMDKDKRKGQNYEVICGDAILYMETAKVSFMIYNLKSLAD